MSPCTGLTVVFTSSRSIDDHLFAKAIKWADQNPEDVIFWARRKPLNRVPNIPSLEWSSKISALRRIRFGYNRRHLVASCIDEAVRDSLNSDVAAIFCSIPEMPSGSKLGSLLAALVHFCDSSDGRAVVVIKDSQDVEDEEEDKDEQDSFENPELFEEEEEEDFKPKNLKNPENKTEEEKEDVLTRLKTVSFMFTRNVFNFDGHSFVPL